MNSKFTPSLLSIYFLFFFYHLGRAQVTCVDEPAYTVEVNTTTCSSLNYEATISVTDMALASKLTFEFFTDTNEQVAEEVTSTGTYSVPLTGRTANYQVNCSSDVCTYTKPTVLTPIENPCPDCSIKPEYRFVIRRDANGASYLDIEIISMGSAETIAVNYGYVDYFGGMEYTEVGTYTIDDTFYPGHPLSYNVYMESEACGFEMLHGNLADIRPSTSADEICGAINIPVSENNSSMASSCNISQTIPFSIENTFSEDFADCGDTPRSIWLKVTAPANRSLEIQGRDPATGDLIELIYSAYGGLYCWDVQPIFECIENTSISVGGLISGRTIFYQVSLDNHTVTAPINFCIRAVECDEPTYELNVPHYSRNTCGDNEYVLNLTDMGAGTHADILINGNVIFTDVGIGSYNLPPYNSCETTELFIDLKDATGDIACDVVEDITVKCDKTTDCAAAISISEGADEVAGNICGASFEMGLECNSDGFLGYPDVWHQFIAQSSSPDILIQAGFNPNYELYSGDCDNLIYEGCAKGEELMDWNLTIGKTYYIRIYSFPITYPKGRGGEYLISIASNNILPLEFANFSGYTTPSANILNWTTASEVNVSHFELEHSHNGQKDWETLAKITAKGGTNLQDYQYKDINLYEATYYQLRSIDQDGSMQFSEVIYLQKENDKLLTISPVPATDRIQLNWSGTIDTTLKGQLSNVNGQVVKTFLWDSKARENQGFLDIQNLPAGVYILSTRIGMEQQLQKVIKQ